VTNVFDLETWGSPGGSGTLGGHFFHFFFGVGSGSEPVPGLATRGGGSWGRDRGPGPRPRHRSRTDSRYCSAIVIASIVVTRSHSERFDVRSRSRRSSPGRLRHGIKSTTRHRSIASSTSHDLLTIFDRSERSRTSFDARGNFPRARSVSDRATRSVRPRKLGHIRSRECLMQLRSILIDLRTSRRIGNFFLRSHRRPDSRTSHFFRVFDPKKRVSDGPLTPLPTKFSLNFSASVRPLTSETRNFRWG